MSEHEEHVLDDAVEVNTPWFKVRGTGILGVVMLLTAMIIGAIFYVAWQMQEEHRMIVQSQKEMIMGVNDLFVAVMTPPEVKENLPAILKDKMKRKVEEKAVRKLEKIERQEQMTGLKD